ncbi:ABC transporter substrate-binding protein [Paenibacillus sp. OV219]|uniref:ABC transporter substrate-binding protein n=1 Tax=Paenibacillus sp. OV219 TaxID=1884377 RepID=UPI0008B57C40|nr:extracellular solute-binding protein [Paenibacillus sp. OV219]SEO66228.1 multiple sugar transport system substrate-binding protein [Paenibacillus sp. OV219]
MKSSKVLLVFMIAAVVISMLAGCSGKSNDSQKNSANNAANKNTNAASDATNAANTNQSADNTATAPEETPAWKTEKFKLKYADGGDNKLEEEMLKAFMEKYPNITVEYDKSITFPPEPTLTAAAAAGTMPDVFTMKDVPLAITNDWLLDLAPYWDKDEESKSVYKNIADMAVYDSKRYAMGTFQYAEGVFVNKTLFEKNNVKLPSYNWTFDEMIELAKKFSKPDEFYYGIGGPWGDLGFQEWLPMNNDNSFGWDTYDGDKFHFTSQDWIDAYNLKLELRRLKVDDVMTGAQKKKLWGDEGAWTFQKGHSAMAIDYSWNMGWIPSEMKKAGAGDVDFYPMPSGKAGQRIQTILDFIGVSSTTEHPEAAYELAKWMTWGKDGALKRADIEKAAGQPVTKYPTADQPEVWAKLEANLTLPGEKEVMKLMSNAVPMPIVPGWNDFAAWDTENKFTEKLNSGEYKVADKAKEFEDKANEFVAKAKAAMLK